MMLWSYIKDAVLKYPSQTVSEGETKMTFEELVIFSETFAKKLKGEKCCAILCGSEMAEAMALLGCFAAGVTAVPLSVRYGGLHCNKILDMITPTAVITDIDGELKVLHLSDSVFKEPKEHPALIMCTSGTTGRPKGAMLSEENVLTNLKDIFSYFDIGQNDRILISRPLYHCAVLTGEFLISLLKGVKIHFYSGKFNPKMLLNTIREYGITVFCGTPTMLSMMARFRRSGFDSTLKTICISGECMDEKTARTIENAFGGACIYHVYGMTEACPRISYLPPHLFREYPCSVGMPLTSVSLKIIAADERPAKTGEDGILWVKGKNVMLGYYNDHEQTVKVLKDGWLCTGDIARIDENGFLRILGRNDDLIIRAGMNIYPQEIESTLKTDPRVREVLVYKIDNPHTGVQIGMKISGDFSDIDEIKQLCIEVLPSFQIPTYIELLPELMKSGSGKIIRNSERR